MYSLKVPHKDFKKNPRNPVVYLNLTEREVFKLLPQLQKVFAWRAQIESSEITELDTQEVVDFYDAFEEILLTAWGTPSEDGLRFDKSKRYEIEDTSVFNAVMVMMVTQPEETSKVLSGIMPEGMEEMVKTQAENMAKFNENNPDAKSPAELQAEIERLRAQIPSPTNTTDGTAPQA